MEAHGNVLIIKFYRTLKNNTSIKAPTLNVYNNLPIAAFMFTVKCDFFLEFAFEVLDVDMQVSSFQLLHLKHSTEHSLTSRKMLFKRSDAL